MLWCMTEAKVVDSIPVLLCVFMSKGGQSSGTPYLRQKPMLGEQVAIGGGRRVQWPILLNMRKPVPRHI